MKKGRMLIAIVMSFAFLSSMALANGLNLNSLGTRALTMGGAFVGLADDFSAIFWNPAGIAQFDKKYFGFYGTDIIPSGTYKFDMPIPGIGSVSMVEAKTARKHFLGGLAAYYYPVSENIVVGIGVFTPSGLGSEWNGEDFAAVAMENPMINWRSKIGVVTFAPAIAYKINDRVSIGAALNINYGIFDINMHAGSQDLGVDLGQYSESLKGWGYSATFGILVKPSKMFSLGATFRTSSKVSFSGDATISYFSILGQIPESPLFGAIINTTSDAERDITWPMWIAVGAAFMPTEGLTLTADVQYTQWSKIDTIKTDYKDTFWHLFMSDAVSGKDKMHMYWDDAIQFRFGAEYRINKIAIRGGFYTDPSPAPDRTLNVLLPNYDFTVFTAGFGYNLNGLQIDFGLEYLMGKERKVDFQKTQIDPDWASAMAGTYNMKIVVPNVSVSYKF